MPGIGNDICGPGRCLRSANALCPAEARNSQPLCKPGEWNQVEIIADGHTLMQIVNGHVMATLVDTDPKYYQAKGLIAFEIEGPGTLKISHRNVWLKKLP
jgi:hypothetical protein